MSQKVKLKKYIFKRFLFRLEKFIKIKLFIESNFFKKDWYINCLKLNSMPKETIIIFDQEPHTRWILKTLLENEQYIVIPLQDIDRLKQNFKEFEISALITEYWSNNGCMVDHIRELKRSFPELYVMMLTYKDIDENEYLRILDSGVDDIFLKPLSTKKILIHLEKGLRQRRLYIEKRRIEKELMENKVIQKKIKFNDSDSNLIAKNNL